LPILSEFMTRFPSMKSQPIQSFYNNLDQTSKVLNTLKYAQKQGDVSEIQKILAEHPDLEPKLTAISSGINVGRKAIETVQNNPTIDPVQKRQLVDGVLFQIGSMAKMGTQIMHDFHNQINQAKPQEK
jgi:hypothetical protein